MVKVDNDKRRLKGIGIGKMSGIKVECGKVFFFNSNGMHWG